MTQADGTYKRALRRAARLGVTLVVVAAAVGLAMLGRLALAERSARVETPAPVAPQVVTAARFALTDGYGVERVFAGQIEPAQRTAAGFEFGGTIVALFADEGDAVAAGEPLARLDTRLLEAERDRLTAERDAASAQAELAARTTDRQTALQGRGFASSQALDAASLGAVALTARIAEIDAGLRAVAIRIEKATLTAPFAGRVSGRHLDLGASVEPGRPVLSLVETAGAQFRVGLSPDALRAIPEDGVVAIEIDGVPSQGRLRAALPDLDAATRARTAVFALDVATPPAWRSVGVLRLTEVVSARGAWVPVSALEAGPRGLWRILTVVEHEGRTVVATESVEILHAEAERAFVRGTVPDGAFFIVDGAHRVVPGQQVRVAEPGA